METKFCSKCKEEKRLTNYHKHKLGAGGLRATCIECEKKYVKDNKEIYNQRAYNYYLKNKETRHLYSKEWRKKNPEKTYQQKKEWGNDNKDKIQIYNKRHLEKSIKECKDSYVITMIVETTKIPIKELRKLPEIQDIVAAKGILIQLKRAIKQNNHDKNK